MSDQFPLFEAVGDHRELGRQHGEQAREQITGFLDYLASSLQLSSPQLRDRALAFQPFFERSCPHLLEEIHGLAEGAGMEFADALAVQIRGELGQVPDGACTTFVIGRSGTADGRVLIGQTSDMAAEIAEYCYMLRVKPADKPAAIMWTFGGMLGYHGLNEHGVAHFANSLGGGPEWKFALPHYPLKRMILEQDCLESVRGLLDRIPVCSNGNYVLCDGRGSILDVEMTSDGPLYLEADREADRQGFLAHSNHFLCGPHDCRENLDLSLPDSVPRLERMNELIAAKFGQLTEADFRDFLRDHAGHPVSICRHPQDESGYGIDVLPADGHTVAALIAEPERGILHVCRGNPCVGDFVAYDVGG